MTQEGLEQIADMAIRPPIVISGPAERFTCEICGREYVSRGKKDPGNLCRTCECGMASSLHLIGGPLDGQATSSGQLMTEDDGSAPTTEAKSSKTEEDEMTSKVEKATTWMEHLADDDSHGYKWGGWGPQDYDCGHAIIAAWEEAGVPVKANGATYTETMQPAFLACGFRDVTGIVNLKTGTGLKRGDVLLNTINHAAMYIGNGQIVHARGSEGNTIPGDQNGREICTQAYFDYPWNCVLRYPEAAAYVNPEPTENAPLPPMKADGICGPTTWAAIVRYIPTLQHGSNGPAVKVLQEAINRATGAALDIDGDFGDNTELALREFQEALVE